MTSTPRGRRRCWPLLLIVLAAAGCAPAATRRDAGQVGPELGPTARAILHAQRRRAARSFAEGELPSGSVDLAVTTAEYERRRGAQRTRPEAVPIAFDQLPVVRVPPMLRIEDAPPSVAPGDPDLEVLASNVVSNGPALAGVHTAMVRARALQLAEVRIGNWVSFSGDISGAQRGSTLVRCLSGSRDGLPALVDRPRPARWEGIAVFRAPENNRLEYHIVDAWFDHQTCAAKVVRKTTVPLHEIVPGVLYAFRDRCDCGVDEVLTLVMPSARSMVSTQSEARLAELRGSFTRVRLPIGDGIESMMAHLGEDDLHAWSRAASPPLKGVITSSGHGAFVAVEVSGPAGPSSAAPRAIAFVERDRRDADVPDLRRRNRDARIGRFR